MSYSITRQCGISCELKDGAQFYIYFFSFMNNRVILVQYNTIIHKG